jgi:cellulose 1,4-beta-cellobiosidase
VNQLLNWLRGLARCGRPNRRVLTSLALLFLAIGVTAAFAQHVVNPFAGTTQYVNPDYAKEVNSAIAPLPPGSALANQKSVVAAYPTAVWLDRRQPSPAARRTAVA